MIEKCSFPKCKNLSDLLYIGREICQKHYDQLCEIDPKQENKLLKKINLTRNDSGKIVDL